MYLLEKIPKLARRAPFELLIGAAIVLLATVLFIEHRYTDETSESSREWSSASDELNVRVTESHLWLEERLSGDKTIDVGRQVFGNIDGAGAQCRALVNGGRTDVGEIERLPAGKARATAARSCAEIVSLRVAAVGRLSGGGKDVGQPADQAYDASFSRVIDLSRKTKAAVGRHVKDRDVLTSRVNTATIVFIFLLLAGIIVLVRRHKVRVRRLSERSESILNSAGEGIYGLDREGRTVFANAAAAQLTGHELEELIGRRSHEIVHHTKVDGSPYPIDECPGAAAARDGRVRRVTDELYWRKDGTSFPVEYTSTPIVENGEVKGAVMVFKDITERKAAEAALAESERRTRQILETAHDGFVAMDAGGLIIDWNPRAEAIFGWSRDETEGRDLAETIIPERDREAHRRGLERFLATGEGPILGQTLELSALHREGHEFPVELTISPLQTEDGCSFNAFVRDITDRKTAEELLERQREQLIEAQSVGGFGSWEWDVAADTTEWSDELYRIYGMERSDEPMSFEDFLQRVHPDDRGSVQAEIQAAYESGEPFSFEHRIVRPDGSVRVNQAHGEVVMADDGSPVRMLGTGQDITERREVERAKDEFTSVVSHELRTPLTSICGSLGLLESGVLGPLPEKGQRMVEIAVENTDRLVRLINDILDIERIDSGKIDMHPAPCQAPDLVAHAVQELGPVAREARVELEVQAEPGALFADADRVHQTLTNLISNAVKFSPPGSTVTIATRALEGEVCFQVVDEGRGIPAEKLETIFQRFQQVDASDSREKGGTGLGLAICRTIVEHHGGRIWAESEPGKGATFSVLLPALGAQAPPGADSAGEGPAILICDDDAAVVEVVGTLLRGRGYRVIETHSGEQALERALAERPDAILLDLLMPGMSGWETAAALKQRPETSEIPIVILSVLSQAETNAPSGPVVDWVEKPLDEAALFGALERAVNQRSEPFKVLVVEDDPDLAGILAATFERHGIGTSTAATGFEAIELSQQLMPDLLVLDIGLPEADGFEVVDWLRRHERLSALPLVVYTARELDETDRERLRLGEMTTFLTKSRITPEDFEQRVVGLLGQARTARRSDEPEAHPVGR